MRDAVTRIIALASDYQLPSIRDKTKVLRVPTVDTHFLSAETIPRGYTPNKYKEVYSSIK